MFVWPDSEEGINTVWRYKNISAIYYLGSIVHPGYFLQLDFHAKHLIQAFSKTKDSKHAKARKERVSTCEKKIRIAFLCPGCYFSVVHFKTIYQKGTEDGSQGGSKIAYAFDK